MKKLLVVAIALIITGCVCVTGAFAAVGWDADRFDLAGTTPRVFTAEGTVTGVAITNLDGTVTVRPGSALRIEYNESDAYRYEVSEDGGAVTLTAARTSGTDLSSGSWLSWIRLPFGTDAEMSRVTVYVPDSVKTVTVTNRNASVYAENLRLDTLSLTTTAGTAEAEEIAAIGAVTLSSSNGRILAEDVTAAAFTAATTNAAVEADRLEIAGTATFTTTNGRISVDDVTAAEVYAETDNAAVSAESVRTDTFTAITDNGRISFDGLDASAARLATGNATIRGTLVGRRSEYTLLLTASNGSCEPGSGGDGPRRFEATTTNGNIRLQFES